MLRWTTLCRNTFTHKSCKKMCSSEMHYVEVDYTLQKHLHTQRLQHWHFQHTCYISLAHIRYNSAHPWNIWNICICAMLHKNITVYIPQQCWCEKTADTWIQNSVISVNNKIHFKTYPQTTGINSARQIGNTTTETWTAYSHSHLARE